ncbi:hypothetical protein D9619_009652 [Psilocybe cf. subviscida]|uniref:C-CAP/cofactor C-like domain-containing protein n=1 Tax=Psilocybe cf. subviscida TaxID=2480587 RepID=A0A8H5BL35_9AGAR|nr:hypothetical protein D9619_009652 [Psilocybe cf. subviscida]
MDASNWDFLQSFTPQFQAMRSEIESRLDTASSAAPGTVSADELNALSALLAKAAKSIADAAGAIPSYDQKQYEAGVSALSAPPHRGKQMEQLKALSKTLEELRTTSAPKSKFAFKRKVRAPGATGAITKSALQHAAPTSVPELASFASSPDDAPLASADSSSPHLLLSGQRNKYLTRLDFPPHTAQTDLSLADLTDCVVDLLPLTTAGGLEEGGPLNLTALHVRNLKDCVVLLPHVAGSALLHDMERCVILLGSHQFRMHTSKQINILLSIASNPIIEHCSAIRFGQYPAAFEPVPKPLPMYTVQDFSHIRATPSPNFSIMPDEETERIKEALETLVCNRGVQRSLQGDRSVAAALTLDIILRV